MEDPRGFEVRLPRPSAPPLTQLWRRVLLALGLLTITALITYFDRSGYRDVNNDGISLIDCFYYATVTITTTGYGDIVPESDLARLLATVVVTPIRIAFVILLVGTTLQILAERSRHAFAVSRWRRHVLRDHVIVCGYGTKGRAAIQTIMSNGLEAERIVVVDPSREAIEAANRAGLAGIVGDAAQTFVLEAADVRDAKQVIVATRSDDNAVLITLTAREHNPKATIVAAVREDDNAHLLHQSGADSVIVSSGAAGRLLGLATENPRLVEVLEDLLTVGQGLDIVEREVTADGSLSDQVGPVVAVSRNGELMRFDDPRAQQLQPGDRVVCLCSLPKGGEFPAATTS